MIKYKMMDFFLQLFVGFLVQYTTDNFMLITSYTVDMYVSVLILFVNR